MAEHSIEKQLQHFFSKATRGDWEKIAVQEINGKDPFETLSWRGKDDIKFLPYYDAADIAGLSHLIPAQNAQLPHQWLNLPAVNVSGEDNANKIARAHLAHGANGIFFYLNQRTSITIAALTRELDFSICNIFLRFSSEHDFHSDPAANALLHKMNGALFWETIPKTSNLIEHLTRSSTFRALGIVIPPSTPAQEIAQALVNGVQAYERFEQPGNPVEVFHSIAFSITADVSFLETAAKIKALRSLWLQIAHAYGHADYNVEDLHIHARSLATPDAGYPPHENLLKATFAAMAATAGGCDSLTLEGTVDSSLFQRWSTNVSHILREESFFDRTANPLAGAYAVEVMSDAIAKKAWETFQQKMKSL